MPEQEQFIIQALTEHPAIFIYLGGTFSRFLHITLHAKRGERRSACPTICTPQNCHEGRQSTQNSSRLLLPLSFSLPLSLLSPSWPNLDEHCLLARHETACAGRAPRSFLALLKLRKAKKAAINVPAAVHACKYRVVHVVMDGYSLAYILVVCSAGTKMDQFQIAVVIGLPTFLAYGTRKSTGLCDHSFSRF